MILTTASARAARAVTCAAACAAMSVAGPSAAAAPADARGRAVSPASRIGAGAASSEAIASATAQRRRRPPAARRRAAARKPPRPDVIFVPTPPETVDEMLRLANLKAGDVLLDVGSGDGRIPIAAAKGYGVRAVGIDIDAKLVEESRASARREGVADLVTFRREDMFAADLRGATVVTLYLSDRLNLLLRPKLLRELRPGSRIVSHDFIMGDWRPERTTRVPWKNLYRTVYLWIVPTGGRIVKR